MVLPGLQDLREKSVLGIASLFLDAERRDIFKTCYAIMRESDDLVDERRAEKTPLSRGERAALYRRIDEILMVRGADRPEARGFRDLLSTHAIPDWPFAEWRRALRFDVSRGRFSSYRSFLNYAEGAAVAPGALFLHLCGMRRVAGAWAAPPFALRARAAPLGLFAYHVHILRDLREDVADGIFFFPRELLEAQGLEESRLEAELREGRISPNLGAILDFYRLRAAVYRDAARRGLAEIGPGLPPRYRRSCEIVLALYDELFERLCHDRGCLLELDPRPSSSLIERIAGELAAEVQ